MTDPELFAPADVVPRVAVMSPFAVWRSVWSTRHTVAAVVLVPVLYFFFRGGIPADVAPSPLMYAAAMVAALGGAVILASYLPATGEHAVATRTPCGSIAWAFVLVAALAFSVASGTTVSLLLPLLPIAMGFAQRIGGAVACPSR